MVQSPYSQAFVGPETCRGIGLDDDERGTKTEHAESESGKYIYIYIFGKQGRRMGRIQLTGSLGPCCFGPVRSLWVGNVAFTGDHSKQGQISLVKIARYIAFCMYRRSYIICFPLPVLVERGGGGRLRNTYSKRSQQANAVCEIHTASARSRRTPSETKNTKKVHTDPHRPTGCLINQPADRPIE